MVVSYISYPRFISRYKLTMMQQIGSNGTNGHMKPRRDIANLRLHWIAKPYFSLRVRQLYRNAKCPCSLACTSSLSQKSLVLSNAQKHNRRTQHYQSAYSACNRLHITIESKTGSDDVAFSWQKKIIICSCGHTLQAQGTVFTITLFVHCRYLKSARRDTGGGDLSLTMAKRRQKPQKSRWWLRHISILCFQWLSVASLCWLPQWQ